VLQKPPDLEIDAEGGVDEVTARAKKKKERLRAAAPQHGGCIRARHVCMRIRRVCTCIIRVVRMHTWRMRDRILRLLLLTQLFNYSFLSIYLSIYIYIFLFISIYISISIYIYIYRKKDR
jgi:hypothetical protein